MKHYKVENANHYIALIAENEEGDIVHNYIIGTDGSVDVQLAFMLWEEIGEYDIRTHTITVTKDRRSHCRILRDFGYIVK